MYKPPLESHADYTFLEHATGLLLNLLSFINQSDYFSHADTADLRRTMQSDYPFVMREYAEAHTLTLVLCRPDGERKRSVRVLRKSP